MGSPREISLVEKLGADHQVRDFKCGKNPLDLFIRKYALVNQRADSSQSYVVHLNNVVMAITRWSLARSNRRMRPSRSKLGCPQTIRFQ